jgi:hypothetical protein
MFEEAQAKYGLEEIVDNDHPNSFLKRIRSQTYWGNANRKHHSKHNLTHVLSKIYKIYRATIFIFQKKSQILIKERWCERWCKTRLLIIQRTTKSVAFLLG